jgi:hypothetical protein
VVTRSGTPDRQAVAVVVGPDGRSITAARQETAAGRGDYTFSTAGYPALQRPLGSLTANPIRRWPAAA